MFLILTAPVNASICPCMVCALSSGGMKRAVEGLSEWQGVGPYAGR